MKKKEKKIYLQQKKRFLKKIIGTIEKPRLSIFRSHKHIYAQLINDQLGETLVFSSTLEKDIREKIDSSSNQKSAFLVGEKIAKKAQNKNLEKCVFDRGNRPYHGRIKSVADGARKQGLVF